MSAVPALNIPAEPTDAEMEEMRERISRIRTALTVICPFFGHLLLKLEIKIVGYASGIPTAGVTRDRKLFVNYHFATPLSDAELTGLLTHEVLHPAMLCWERQGTRNVIVEDGNGSRVSLWNVAHDYAINMIIEDMMGTSSKVKLPEHACLDRQRFNEMGAEEIYDILLDQVNKNSPPPPRGGPGGGQPGGGKGKLNLPKGSWGTDDIKEGDPGSGDGKDMSEAEKRASDQFWKVAVVEAGQVHEQQKGKGSLPGSIKKLIESIVDPKIDWVSALSRWVGEHGRRADFTYRRPARRSEALGETLPSLVKHGVDDIVIGWDTSGSMNGREIEIFSEVIGICSDMAMTIRVICCDTFIHSDTKEVENAEDIDYRGGGGSDFRPMFERLHEEGYQGVVVCFTDGVIDVPAEKPPHIREVLWVLWERDVDPTDGKWGEVMKVDSDGNIVSQAK